MSEEIEAENIDKARCVPCDCGHCVKNLAMTLRNVRAETWEAAGDSAPDYANLTGGPMQNYCYSKANELRKVKP